MNTVLDTSGATLPLSASHSGGSVMAKTTVEMDLTNLTPALHFHAHQVSEDDGVSWDLCYIMDSIRTLLNCGIIKQFFNYTWY